MRFYFDTSSLIKNYLEEIGSEQVSKLIESANEIVVSDITLIECVSVIRRYWHERLIAEHEYMLLKKDLVTDFQDFKTVGINQKLISTGLEIFDKIQIKSLDLIQLSSALIESENIDALISCDQKLIKNAQTINIPTINPLLI